MKINNEIRIIILYAIYFVSLLIALNHVFFHGLLDSSHFINWDAGYYFRIKNNGYEGFNVAFFPLFPMIWIGLSFSIIGIVFFNAILFLTSFYILIRVLKTTTWETILYLSIPSFIFFYLPYTESIFFASSTLLFFGLKDRKKYLVATGLLLCTLSRPAFTVFIPAIIITELLCETINAKLFLRLGLYLAVTLVGLLIVGIIQYQYTGKWFEFFIAQNHWENKLQIPKFPLTSYASGLIVRLDGAAMLVGTIATIILSLLIFKLKSFKDIIIQKEVVFSLCYLAGITFIVLIFRGGNLFSLNRFVFAVPFIIVVADFYFKRKISFSKKQLMFIFLIIFSFWLFFGSYGHIQTLLKFFLLSVYLFLIATIKSDNKYINRISIGLLIFTNLIFQIIFFIRFLNVGWVG